MKYFVMIAICFAGHLAFAQELVGTWKQDCQVIDDDVQQIQLQFSEDTLIWRGIGFEEDGCKTPYINYEEKYSIQKLSGTSTNEFNLDLLTVTATYTPLSDEVAEALNLVAFCDLQTWKAHTPTDVTGKICQDRQVRGNGTAYFQRIALKDSLLLWGDVSTSSDGTTVDRRPTRYEALSFKRSNLVFR